MFREIFWGKQMAKMGWAARIRYVGNEAWRSAQLVIVFVVAALVFGTPPTGGESPLNVADLVDEFARGTAMQVVAAEPVVTPAAPADDPVVPPRSVPRSGFITQ